jgi:hypothetical protein
VEHGIKDPGGFRFNAQEFLIGSSEAHEDVQTFPPLPRFVKLPKPHNPEKKPARTPAAEPSR